MVGEKQTLVDAEEDVLRGDWGAAVGGGDDVTGGGDSVVFPGEVKLVLCITSILLQMFILSG